jgi:hypothetical protein
MMYLTKCSSEAKYLKNFGKAIGLCVPARLSGFDVGKTSATCALDRKPLVFAHVLPLSMARTSFFFVILNFSVS